MKKKVVIAVAAVLLAAVLLAALILGGNAESDPVETTVATTEVKLMGLEENIFDDVTEAAETTEATVPETEETTVNTESTEPTETTKATDPTKSTEPQQQEPEPEHPKDPAPTGPKPTEPKPTETKPTETEPTEPSSDIVRDYKWFLSLSPSEQQAWMATFETIDDFFEWFNAVKAEYEKANPPIEFNGGPIDIGAIIDGKK